MKIVVDIPDEVYDRLKTLNSHGMATGATMYIVNGTPLPKGHWIEGSDTDIMGEKVYWYTCSNCNEDRGQKTNYCPNCGAKMVELQESEDKK